MAFNLKDIIFGFFGSFQVVEDINKDANNKGTLERYNEAMALEYDEEILPLQENIIDNNLVPSTAFFQFIPYLENRVGSTLFMGSSPTARRRVLQYIHRWYAIKGTVRAYELLLGMLGFNVTILEDFTAFTFDSPTTFDDDVRTFDMSCNICGNYTVELTGGLTLDPEIIQAIFSIIKFNEPIHAHLSLVTYNGTPVPAL